MRLHRCHCSVRILRTHTLDQGEALRQGLVGTAWPLGQTALVAQRLPSQSFDRHRGNMLAAAVPFALETDLPHRMRRRLPRSERSVRDSSPKSPLALPTFLAAPDAQSSMQTTPPSMVLHFAVASAAQMRPAGWSVTCPPRRSPCSPSTRPETGRGQAPQCGGDVFGSSSAQCPIRDGQAWGLLRGEDPGGCLTMNVTGLRLGHLVLRNRDA